MLVPKVLKFSDSKLGILKGTNKMARGTRMRHTKETTHIGSLQKLPGVRRDKLKEQTIPSSEHFVKEDKKGGKAFHFSGASGDMGDFMAANDLVDPGFSGPAYTWTNNKDARSRIFSRLDRFLISSSILDSFEAFLKLSNWSGINGEWMMREMRHEELDKEIKELQELECLPSGLIVVQEEALKYKVQLLNSTLARLMLWWKQREKVRWIEEGDGNTRFFHSMASAKRRTNSINSLKLSDGNVVSEQSEILKGMHEFFEQKWKGKGIIFVLKEL
ncbi:uncharacterized protein LOC110115630 [Dendrobium catenatum]|uniref:uncharacterized protein LOC110115630 n=1 Tax=Dendrobium catenatum TaxID=906689 RepID=UPI0009F4FEA5|nr:uncharacterized protein LOC110115630 [Dendrobium catenatum]